MYSRFLGVDLKSIAAEIDTATQMKVEGYQYLTSRASEQPRAKAEPEPSFSMAPEPRSSGSWLPLIVLGGTIVVVAVAFVFWSNVNRLGDSNPEAARPGVNRPGDETAVQHLADGPKPAPVPAPEAVPPPAQPRQPAPPPEPVPPRPVVVSMPKPVAALDATPTTAPGAEPEIPRARPISPVARIAAADADTLADLGPGKPRTPAQTPVTDGSLPEEENNPLAVDPNTIVLEPRRKTWVVVRASRGGQPVYEDYLYPTAKPMRLPAGRYFIELKDADAVEISRNGKRIVYTAPGVAID
jgi:hypothetical protein